MPSDENSVDYIVVGSGAAGSVLAHRLSEDPGLRVLVLEAGGPDGAAELLAPGNYLTVAQDPRWTRRYDTELFGDGQAEHWTTGRVAGGSTSVNGMIWNRGWAGDYDGWGLPGWTWSRFLAAFRAIERRGDGGGLQTIERAAPDPASELWIETLAGRGIATVTDVNDAGGERAGYAYRTIAGGSRVSAVASYLRPAAARPNVELRMGCEVRRILFDGTTAIGVEAVTAEGPVRLLARREVIVCAGTLESPLLLERSGVGDPAVLEAAGVVPVVANPAVGTDLRQHRVGNTVSRLDHGAEGLHGATTVLAALRADPAAASPDTEVLFIPMPGAAVVAFYPHSPTSTGSIHITGPGTGDAPRLVPGYLTTAHDRRLTAAAYALVRELTAAEPFAARATAAFPLPDPADEQAVLTYVLGSGAVGNHQTGTCSLGPGGVVDGHLRVHGTTNLRVADASVMPTLPSGNTAAPTMAVGWIAADLLTGQDIDDFE
jgi:choline dehydrogenase